MRMEGMNNDGEREAKWTLEGRVKDDEDEAEKERERES